MDQENNKKIISVVAGIVVLALVIWGIVVLIKKQSAPTGPVPGETDQERARYLEEITTAKTDLSPDDPAVKRLNDKTSAPLNSMGVGNREALIRATSVR